MASKGRVPTTPGAMEGNGKVLGPGVKLWMQGGVEVEVTWVPVDA